MRWTAKPREDGGMMRHGDHAANIAERTWRRGDPVMVVGLGGRGEDPTHPGRGGKS
jgi:hypothetical protein